MKCLGIFARNEIGKAIKVHNPDCIISIKDIFKKFEWKAFNFKGKRLLLEFEDWEDDKVGGPELKHVQRIIDFGLFNATKTFIVNCEAGVSRSSATAIILQVLGGRSIEAVFEEIATKYTRCFPNKRMIELADEILNTKMIPIYEAWEPLWRMRQSQRNGGGYGIF